MLRRWAAGFLLVFALSPAACTDARTPELVVSRASSSPTSTSSSSTTTSTSSTTTTSTTVLEAPPPPPPAPAEIVEQDPPPAAPADVEDIIRAEFGELAGEALSVAHCESTYDPSAVNGRSRGLFQIHDVHADQWLEVIGRSYWSTWSDPVANAAFAHWLYESSGGWGPWSCKP